MGEEPKPDANIQPGVISKDPNMRETMDNGPSAASLGGEVRASLQPPDPAEVGWQYGSNRARARCYALLCTFLVREPNKF